MLKLNVAICTSLLLCFVNCAPTKKPIGTPGELSALNLTPVGRFYFMEGKLALVSTAVHFGFSFEGREAKLYVSLPGAKSHNYLQYEVDGEYQDKIKIEADSTPYITLKAPTNGRHTVWIYKTTEAHTGAIYIESILANNVRPLREPAAPLIEFIGNSITCGAAADTSLIGCGKGAYHDQHNAYFAYGPRVARALKLNFLISAVSGIGIYRNWNSDGPTMPQVYENTNLLDAAAGAWNFKKYAPTIVSIALGTNDFSKGDGKKLRLPFDSAVFVDNYINFVKLVKSKYPSAQIALLSSPMVTGTNGTILEHCLTAVKQQIDAAYSSDKPVALHFVQPIYTYGCGTHPSVEGHALMARELIPFFKALL